MQIPVCRLLPLALGLLAAGCAAPRSLPKYERPLARAPVQQVRTTAYTHTESDHRRYGARNASGGRLQSGAVKSAACDWSRWPVGTVFRIQETGENYIVDDYGWALAGTNTIDLYQTSRSAMNRWGVRRVHIEILRWGDVRRSLAILEPRSRHAHVRRMLSQIRSRYSELSRSMPVASSEALTFEHAVDAESAAFDDAPPTAPAIALRPEPGGFIPSAATSSTPLTPFAVQASRAGE